MPEPVTEDFVRSLVDRAMFIVSGGKHANREDMQTFAADAGRLCCDWFREHGIEVPAPESDCPSCQQGNCPP